MTRMDDAMETRLDVLNNRLAEALRRLEEKLDPLNREIVTRQAEMDALRQQQAELRAMKKRLNDAYTVDLESRTRASQARAAATDIAADLAAFMESHDD